jgi:hypothetical protein
MELIGRFERSLVVGYEPKVQELALAIRAAVPEAPVPQAVASAEPISLAPARGKLYLVLGLVAVIIAVAVLLARR